MSQRRSLRHTPLACALLVLVVLPVASLSAQRPALRADSIERAVRAAIPRVPWPGFRPESIPLAIYDGVSSTLYRHPAPPAEFTRVNGGPATMSGRHPAITANSSADIGGRTTATVNADRPQPGSTVEQLAAVALHESFHVFQREHHKGWVGNEGDLFTYPVSDAALLTARRLESDALRRALAASNEHEAACWSRAFLTERTTRFRAMPEAFPRYERLTELNEGLANYIQFRANGRSTVEIPREEFAPAAVRIRIYTIGPAIAFLLDRFAPQWKDSLEAHDTLALDQLLGTALAARPADATACSATAAEREEAHRTAARDSAAIAASRTAHRAAFDARTGPRLVLEAAAGAPLWPQGFDPLNVELTDGGLLHTRFLKLGNDAATVALIDEKDADIDALSVAAGAHPLFNGVRRLEAVGFGTPEVKVEGSTVTITASGLTLTARNATLRREGERLFVTIAASATPPTPATARD